MKSEKPFSRIGEALQHAILTDRAKYLAQGLRREQMAMVMIWYGTDRQVRDAAIMVADHIRPQLKIEPGTPGAWLVDAVLFNSGHRSMMTSIPNIALQMLKHQTDGKQAFALMWSVSEVLGHVARDAWRDAADMLRKAGWVK